MIINNILKSCTFSAFFVLHLALSARAQQVNQPTICRNPPSGYTLAGDFSPNTSIACLSTHPVGTSTIVISKAIGIDQNSQEYIFDYKDGDSLLFKKENKFTATKEGFFWIVQKGTITTNGMAQNVLVCKAIEVIKTEMPEVEISTCGPKTINILIKDTPINRKQSGYQIQYDWDFINTYEKNKDPFLITFTHPTDSVMLNPSIHAFYSRNKVKVCYSSAVQFSVIKTARLKDLQSMDYGKEVKIQMDEGEAEKEYYIQYKAKTALEWVESSVRIKRNASQVVGEATIAGLEPATQYCFRLVEKDACNYVVSYSNEMCVPLVLSTEYNNATINIAPNPGEDKIRINSSGAPVRYIELFDMKGRLIYKGEIADDTFNLSGFEKGKYILRLYDSNKKLLNTKSIVKW